MPKRRKQTKDEKAKSMKQTLKQMLKALDDKDKKQEHK